MRKSRKRRSLDEKKPGGEARMRRSRKRRSQAEKKPEEEKPG
jgi:hypothetical protein